MDTRARTLVKAFVWNAIGLLVMAGVGFFLTGSLTLGGAIAAVNTAVGLVCYVLYERVWAHIGWGRRYA